MSALQWWYRTDPLASVLLLLFGLIGMVFLVVPYLYDRRRHRITDHEQAQILVERLKAKLNRNKEVQ
jgi:hypothetical protein